MRVKVQNPKLKAQKKLQAPSSNPMAKERTPQCHLLTSFHPAKNFRNNCQPPRREEPSAAEPQPKGSTR